MKIIKCDKCGYSYETAPYYSITQEKQYMNIPKDESLIFDNILFIAKPFNYVRSRRELGADICDECYKCLKSSLDVIDNKRTKVIEKFLEKEMEE